MNAVGASGGEKKWGLGQDSWQNGYPWQARNFGEDVIAVAQSGGYLPSPRSAPE
jgi:hypothetical protein